MLAPFSGESAEGPGDSFVDNVSQPPLLDMEEPLEATPTREGYWGPLPGESPELYERLGIRHFKKWLPTTGDFVRRHASSSSEGDGSLPQRETLEDSLEELIESTKAFETIHLGLFAILGSGEAATVALLLPQDRASSVAIFGALNIATNAYPIMLQRYNRLRAYRVLDRIRSRRNARPTDD